MSRFHPRLYRPAVANDRLAVLGTRKHIIRVVERLFAKDVLGTCKSDGIGKTDEEIAEELMKRAEANDAGAMYALANLYDHGHDGLLQDRAKALELWKQATGSSMGIITWVCIIMKREIKESQVPLRGRGYGWTQSRKMQPRNNKGSIRT